MSQGDLATTFRRAMEAYSRGDYDAAMRDFDPAIEWSVDLSVTPDATTYHGHQGVKRFWETWRRRSAVWSWRSRSAEASGSTGCSPSSGHAASERAAARP